MVAITVDLVTESLKKLPPEKLLVVYDFISYLAARETAVTMSDEGLAEDCTEGAKSSLREIWDRPEEDAAWAHL